jgi:hypothetical protein
MIHRESPNEPICLHCGTVIADLREGQGKIALADGCVIGGEYYVHAACSAAFEQDYALPDGQCWVHVPLAQPWRAWAVAAFIETRALLAARAVGS